MPNYVISGDEWSRILKVTVDKMSPDDPAVDEIMRISGRVLQRKIPSDSLGFCHPSRTPDNHLTVSLFPQDWAIGNPR